MLESFNTDNFSYQKLSLEEQQSRGILGRLKGVIADTVNPTRNGRKYSAKLWEKVFDDPIMKEKIENRCVFGELGHPADREETDMEKIALCLAEQPKKGKDGKLYGVFDILNTPNGRILKTLCDYGCNIGISSRGSGDLITDMNGDEAVDEDTYDCQGFDAVLVPAVKEARLAYVNEALNKVKYNKSLKTKLQESLEKATADEKKVMQEALDTLGVVLNEDDLHQKFRQDAKAQYKDFNKKLDRYNQESDDFDKWLDSEDIANPEKVDRWKELTIGKKPEFKLDKGNADLERENYPFYVTTYEGTSYFHPEEGGYYQAGLEPVYSEGFQTFEEAQQALEEYLAETGSTIVSFKPSNVAVDDDNYSYSESEEEYRPVYDNKDRLIGIVAEGKYIGEEEQIWIEPNKYYLSRQVGYEMYESLDERNLTKSEKHNRDLNRIFDYKKSLDNAMKKFLVEYGISEDEVEELYQKDSLDKKLVALGLHDEFFDKWLKKNESFENNEARNEAVDNNEAMVEELQKSLSKIKELQDKLVNLQEKLSVSYAKESRLNEEIDKQKNAIGNLSKNAAQVMALNNKVTALENDKKLLESKLKDKDTLVSKLREAVRKDRDTHQVLKESISDKETSNQQLNEKLVKLSSDNKHLTEVLEDLKKDSEIKKSEYSKRLDQSNKLVEKYKRIAAKSVDKYIDAQALKLGVDSNEIKNKLPESYTFKDIDEACESVKQYRVNINKLPFNTMLKEDIQIKATPSKNEKLANIPGFDDDVDDQLLSWANLD